MIHATTQLISQKNLADWIFDFSERVSQDRFLKIDIILCVNSRSLSLNCEIILPLEREAFSCLLLEIEYYTYPIGY
jgi:hypothetical protein